MSSYSFKYRGGGSSSQWVSRRLKPRSGGLKVYRGDCEFISVDNCGNGIGKRPGEGFFQPLPSPPGTESAVIPFGSGPIPIPLSIDSEPGTPLTLIEALVGQSASVFDVPLSTLNVIQHGMAWKAPREGLLGNLRVSARLVGLATFALGTDRIQWNITFRLRRARGSSTFTTTVLSGNLSSAVFGPGTSVNISSYLEGVAGGPSPPVLPNDLYLLEVNVTPTITGTSPSLDVAFMSVSGGIEFQ